MDHAVRRGCSAAQASQVFQITAMHLSTSGRIRTSEAEHLMVRLDEFLTDGRADEACRAGDENTPSCSPFQLIQLL